MSSAGQINGFDPSYTISQCPQFKDSAGVDCQSKRRVDVKSREVLSSLSSNNENQVPGPPPSYRKIPNPGINPTKTDLILGQHLKPSSSCPIIDLSKNTPLRKSHHTSTKNSLKTKETCVLLNRAHALKDLVPMLSLDSRLQEAAKMLTSQFKDKITFGMDEYLTGSKSAMTIGQRVYFHLFLILYLDNPSGIKADDPKYVAKAFVNQDECHSTADQRRLAIERTCVELTIESLHQILESYHPSNNTSTEHSLKNSMQVKGFLVKICSHVDFLKCFKVSPDSEEDIGTYYEQEAETASTYEAQTGALKNKYAFTGAMESLLQELPMLWGYKNKQID